MRNWIRNKLILWCQSILARCFSTLNKKELELRKKCVYDFFHTTLPQLDSENWGGKTILKGVEEANYFKLPNGDWPGYDLILPQIPLFVCVPGIASSTWEDAKSRGISRLDWEKEQERLSCIDIETKRTKTLLTVPNKVLIVKWNEPTNHHSLRKRLAEILKEK